MKYVYSKKAQSKTREKTKNREGNQLQRKRELRNYVRESLDVSPQALEQSWREPVKRASNLSSDLSKSSEVRQLCSFQIHHIKHNTTKFQMLEECFYIIA